MRPRRSVRTWKAVTWSSPLCGLRNRWTTSTFECADRSALG
jgi:hypothetical protein